MAGNQAPSSPVGAWADQWAPSAMRAQPLEESHTLRLFIVLLAGIAGDQIHYVQLRIHTAKISDSAPKVQEPTQVIVRRLGSSTLPLSVFC